MSLMIFANNASSLLASSILSTDTELSVQPGEGALFPAIGAGQIAVVTLEDVSGNIEIVHATGITGDVLTIVRAQESTAAMAFASGSRVELRVTAGILAALLQKTGGDLLNGTTTFSGVLAMGSSGSIQGGEYAGGKVRGAPGETDNEFSVPTGGGPPTIGGSVVLTAANLATHLPSGFDLIHANMIVWFFGSTLSIPTGWQLCDGTGGTPDLRDKFVLGGGGALPSSGGSASTTTGSTNAGAVTVSAHALTVAELPAHHHDSLVVQGTHNTGSPSANPTSAVISDNGVVVTRTIIGSTTGDTGSGAGHTHTATSAGGHQHTYTLPPYIALLAIMKL